MYKLYPWGPIKCGLYKQVVFIYRWSVEEVGLYNCKKYSFLRCLCPHILPTWVLITEPCDKHDKRAFHMIRLEPFLREVAKQTKKVCKSHLGIHCLPFLKFSFRHKNF